MTLAYQSVGNQISDTSSFVAAYATASSSGDLLILCISNKYPPNVPSDISGWTKWYSQGGSGSGVDSGSTYATAFWKLSTGSEPTSLGVQIPSGNTCTSRMLRYSATSGTIVTSYGLGPLHTNQTSWHVPSSTGNMGLQPRDLLLAIVGVAGDAAGFSSQVMTCSGVSSWTMNERVDSGTSTGQDCSLMVSEHKVEDGFGTAAPEFKATVAASRAGAVLFFRIREVYDVTLSATQQSMTFSVKEATASAVLSETILAGKQDLALSVKSSTVALTQCVTLSATANIAAGATTDTTAQLSPPSAKTTSDFQASKISDDTNPITLDLSSDKYSELEFSVNIGTFASNGDEFQFRITNAGTALDTYTVTPLLAIGATAFPILADKQSLSFSVLSATVSTEAPATVVEVGKQDLTFSTAQAQVLTDWLVSAAKQDLTFTVRSASVAIDTQVAASKQDLAFQTRAATTVSDCTFSASKQDLAFSTKQATITAWDIWADSYTVNLGPLASGSLADTRAEDTSYMVFDEVAGVYPAGGFSIDFFFNDIPSTISTLYVDLIGYYSGNPAHTVKVQAYNYNTTTWEDLTAEADDMPSRSTDATYQWAISITNNVSGGQLRFRFLHTTNGSAGHTLNINKFFLSETYSVTIEAEKQDLTISAISATVAADTSFSVAKQDLVFAVLAATVSTADNVTILSTKQDLTLSVLTATVAAGTSVSVQKQDLTLTTKTATVLFDTLTSGNKQDLTFTVLAASASTADNIVVAVGKQDLLLSMRAAGVLADTTVASAKQDLVFSTQTAAVLADTTVAAAKQDLIFSTRAASTLCDTLLTVSKQNLLFSTMAASVLADTTTSAAKQDLVFSTKSAAVLNDQTIVAAKQDLYLTVRDASVSTSDSIVVAVSKQDLVLSSRAASIAADTALAVAKQDLLFSVNAAVPSSSVATAVSKQDLTFSTKAATVSSETSVTVTTTVQQIVFSSPAGQVKVDCLNITSKQDLTFGVLAPQVTSVVVVPAGVLSLGLSINQISFYITHNLQPDTQHLTFGMLPVVVSVAQVQGYLVATVEWFTPSASAFALRPFCTSNMDSQPSCAVESN